LKKEKEEEAAKHSLLKAQKDEALAKSQADIERAQAEALKYSKAAELAESERKAAHERKLEIQEIIATEQSRLSLL